MAISDGSLSAADVAAVTNGGFGGFGNGDSGWWLILLFLFAFGGWGNNGWGNGGNGGVPYVVNDVQRGFDQSAIMSGISGIQTSLSNAEVSRCNQTANITNQLTNMAANQASCCCENRLAIANLSADIAREACADRASVTDALRDVLEANNASTQRILDQMCADKIDAKNEQIAALQQQLTMSQLAASQNAQTAAIIANNEAQTNALERYLAPVPIPAYIVQNPNGCGCGYNYGCGCGYGA
jgi:hypothetical protein